MEDRVKTVLHYLWDVSMVTLISFAKCGKYNIQPSERGSFSKEETRFEVNRGDITQIFLEIEAFLQHFSQGRNAYIVIVQFSDGLWKDGTLKF